MSFHDKGFWMGKGSDGESLFGNSSRVESKRSHQWFADATETELFPHKRPSIESPNSKSISSHLSWDHISSFQSSPTQFIDRLLGSPVGMDNTHHVNKKTVHDQPGVGLSMSYTIEDPENCVSYGGIRKVKINQVKDTNSSLSASKECISDMSLNHVYSRENETSFITVGPNYGFDVAHGSAGTTAEKDEENPMSTGHSFNKGDTNTISFGGFQDGSDINPLARPINGYYVKAMDNYGLSIDHSTVKSLQCPGNTKLNASKVTGGGNVPQVVKSKSKVEPKPAKKEAPTSFPSNVRSLMATGILDGVPVKYVSPSREELRGIIKGSGYLCGCQSCNHSKALNAYEFERHAGCKTKHPNNHIYFESGKSIYQIVQELRSTQETLLFDAILTITGSPINQKAFRSWKESFLAATRELQRIYGKDELNI